MPELPYAFMETFGEKIIGLPEHIKEEDTDYLA
jgi:hypothetical protein